MRQSFRAKLILMLSVLAFGFAVLIGVSTLIERQVARDLALIQERFIPLITLGPKLEHAFEHMRRALQDAVAAQDTDALEDTRVRKDALLRNVEAGRGALSGEQVRALSRQVEDYYALAFDVSRRLLEGESGDQLPAAVLVMQNKQTDVLAALREATVLDHDALAQAFAEASDAQRTATRVRLAVSLASLAVVLLLSLLISRGLLRALAELGAGFARFGRGQFSVRIREQGDQELLQVAQQANQMAESLERIGQERDRQQEKLAQKNEELSEARQRVEQKARELAAVSSYKSQFLANMSHELRTPLNSMLVLSSLLADNEAGNLTAKQVEYCRTIHGAGTDLLSLINQVLDLAKIESGKQDVQAADLALNELADYARRIFEPLARAKGLSFEVKVDGELPAHMFSDRRRIEQIINNLVGNAIKFTERGLVLLQLHKPSSREGMLALEIRDTGVGIPSEHQERIFAAFEQLNASSDRSHGGTGLGLSIARELALLLGGEIELHSTPGRGSTFTCYLPLSYRVEAAGLKTQRPAAEAKETPVQRERGVDVLDSADAALALHPANLFQGATILVADDDMRTLYALSAFLHAKGAEVLTVDSAKAAFDELERHPNISAVLIDSTLPDEDVSRVLRRIRDAPRFAELPMITLASEADAGRRDVCLRNGATAHLVKPVDADRLCTLLRFLLHGAATEQAAGEANH